MYAPEHVLKRLVHSGILSFFSAHAMSLSPSSYALALRSAPQAGTHRCGDIGVIVHHTMPASICREWERRNTADQYKMFSWNGWVLPGAEDFETGVVCESNSRDDEQPYDWDEDGLIVEARTHPKDSILQLARRFFDLTGGRRREWRFGEKNDPGGILEKFTTKSMSIISVVDRHLRAKIPRPLFWGVVKSLRDAQAIMRTPSYSKQEAMSGAAPRGILKCQSALSTGSAKRLNAKTGGAWCGSVNLELVADFLVGRHVFLAWAAQARYRKDRKDRTDGRKKAEKRKL